MTRSETSIASTRRLVWTVMDVDTRTPRFVPTVVASASCLVQTTRHV